MKRRTLGIIIAVAVPGLVAAMAASFLHDGLSSRASPTVLEKAVARKARHLAIPSNARLTPNPVLASAEDLRDARLHFADHCAILRLPETQNLSDGELFWIIENGVRFTGMPAFSEGGGHGGMQDSWTLVHFIRHLPHLTPAERIEMERYNPKGPEDRAEEERENDFLNGATPQQKQESKDHRQE